MLMLKIYLLGHLGVTLNGQTIVGFRSVKTTAILGYLAIRQEPVRRSELIELVWPDYKHKARLASLRSALANLRDLLGDHINIARYDVELVNYWCDANVVGTRTTKLTLMPGCEGIDSVSFQSWLRSLQTPPPYTAKRADYQYDSTLSSVQDALVMLSNLGWGTEATKALTDLGAWMLDAGHPNEAEQLANYASFIARPSRKHR